MLNTVVEKLSDYRPIPQPEDSDPAAVLLLLTDELHPDLIFTVRSSAMRKHGGEVAFPGGKVEPGDADLWMTALRETEEETGVGPDKVRLVGELDQRKSRFGSTVSPFVGLIPAETEFLPDPMEVESVFRVPMAYFLDIESNLFTRTRVHEGKSIHVPYFEYDGFNIFGLTAMITINLVDVLLGTSTEVFAPRPR